METSLNVGDIFDTPFETGCVVTEPVDSDGNFVAIDSDGVECNYTVRMVIGHPQFQNYTGGK
jgi:hypothetical protein